MSKLFEIVRFTNKVSESLPKGQAIFFLRTEDKTALLEGPTAFLHDCYVQNKKHSPSVNTWAAAAQAIKSWLEFLPEIKEFKGRGSDPDLWLSAARADRVFYRDCYMQFVNDSTGESFSDVTISSRMVVIMRLYEWADARGMYNGDMLTALITTGRDRIPIDMDMMAHTRGGSMNTRMEDIDLPKVPRSSGAKVKPIEPDALAHLLNLLGPTPTLAGSDSRQCRNRVFADLIVDTGIRLTEAMNLTVIDFLKFATDPEKPFATQPLTIKNGKGKKTRIVNVHNWIIEDVISYINGEREQSLRSGRITSRQASNRIWLNSPDHRLAGRPISGGGMQKLFSQSCIAAGFVDRLPYRNLDTGEVTDHIKAAFSIHNLRHTFAVRYCEAQWMMGNTEPWLALSRLLGHASPETTKKHYLGFVDFASTKHVILHTRQHREMGA